VKGNVTY